MKQVKGSGGRRKSVLVPRGSIDRRSAQLDVGTNELPPKVKLPWFSPAVVEAEVNHPGSQPGQGQLSFTFLKRGVLS